MRAVVPDHRPSAAIHCVEDARRRARRRMPRVIFDFVDGAAGTEAGERLNRTALAGIRLQPRVLVNVEGRCLSQRLLGQDFGLPFGIAPMGMCDLTWPGADTMLAVEAARRRIPLCVSSASSTSLEDMWAAAREQAWFQLYVGASIDQAMGLAERAATCGYRVLVLTVDVPQVARRIRDLHNGFRVPFRIGPRLALDFARHPRWSLSTLLHGRPSPKNFDTPAGTNGFVRDAGRGGVDWAFLARLRRSWRGALVVKGVLSAADAMRIRDSGADAIYVSNHGGRQLDSAPPAIEMLPRIRAAVGGDFPLIFDSGVRSGEDVV
ncbi:MAG: alpha-hydroxy-acid oxidizing protein, partial [Alphaproteobacteria bacterium]|nr:alpha-hydroxy-acid oxidizing protein [Alphaproteobacteria bacterium]